MAYIFNGAVATLSNGTRFYVTSSQGSVNFKGRKVLPDETLSSELYNVPRRAVVEAEYATGELGNNILKSLESDIELRLGVVVRFKKPVKGFESDQRWVVIREANGTFSLAPLGGDVKGRYLRGVSPAQVEVIEI